MGPQHFTMDPPIPPAFSMLGIGGPNLFFKTKYLHSLHFKEDSLHNINHLQNLPLVINNLLLQNIHNMFSATTYQDRRTVLQTNVESGILLFLGKIISISAT